MKLKIVLYLFFILKSTASFSQSGYKVLYDRLGLHLYYKYEFYNSIKINNDLYDQYKITGFAEYEGNKPIFTPLNFKLSFQELSNKIVARYYSDKMNGNEPNYIPYNKLINKLPNSRSDIDFRLIEKGQQPHKFWCIGSLAKDKPIDIKTSPTYINNILLTGYKSECSIYIIVDKGMELPIPKWEVSDLRRQIEYVEPYWEINNVALESSLIDKNFNAIPIGNQNDVAILNTGNSRGENKKTEEKTYENGNTKGTFVENNIEDLKKMILNNLRQNTSEIKASFTDEYSTETIKYSDQFFNFNGEYFEFQFQFIETKRLKSIDYYERMTAKKVLTKIPISDLNGVLDYKENKAYPKQLIFLNKKGCSKNGKYIFTDCYNNDHVIEAGEMLEPQSFFYGYNFGRNDENYATLKNLISELKKQIDLISQKK